MSTCTGCDTAVKLEKGQWWHLTNYFGFSGFFCPKCYDKVSHDGYDQPKNPKEYLLMLVKCGNQSYRQKEHSSI